jgi:hypothetical protein
MLPQPAEARTRRRIGRYLITGRVGRGGMGMVYRGYDETLERSVAIKTLTIEGSLEDETRRRFEVEAVMPALSCSRRSLSALTRLTIGSRTVVAAQIAMSTAKDATAANNVAT